MSQLQAIQLDGGITIYIEANEQINAPVNHVVETETTRSSRDLQQTTQRAIQNFANLQDAIKTFAVYILNSFKQIADRVLRRLF
ncbi:MAG: hypothetical protein Q7U23_13490 [Methylococcales bacterium]|nr:hypothetical protein [Methylococcales bacterium]